MKIAITCDTLIERNHYTEIIEDICDLFPEAKIYCFVHKEGKILGHIEQRKITSTYLSRKLRSDSEFYSLSFQLPGLAKKIFISCEYDLIVNISNGFSQGFSKCKQTKQITYLYNLNYESKLRQTFLQKIFYSFVSSWALNSLKQADLVIASTQDIFKKVSAIHQNVELLDPPFKLSDYALFPKNMFAHKFFAIESDQISVTQARQLVQWFTKWGHPILFIGNDDHLTDLKKELGDKMFFGQKCSGEHAPVLASSKALVCFMTSGFPKMALATLATGRPVISNYETQKWINGTGSYFANFDEDSLKAMVDEVINNEEHLEGSRIRSHVQKYNESKFKVKIKSNVERLLSVGSVVDHDCQGCH